MARAIPQADSAAAVNLDHLLAIFDPANDAPIAQKIRDVMAAIPGATLSAILDAHFGSGTWRQGVAGAFKLSLVDDAADFAILRAEAEPSNMALAVADFARGDADIYLVTGSQPANVKTGDLYIFDGSDNRWERAVNLPAVMAGTATNLSVQLGSDYVDILSSTGTDGRIPEADDQGTNTAGVLSGPKSRKLDRQDENPRSTPAARTGPWLPLQRYQWHSPGNPGFAKGDLSITAPSGGNRNIIVFFGDDDVASGAVAVLTELAAAGARIKLLKNDNSVAYEGTLIAGVAEVLTGQYRVNSTPISYAPQPDNTPLTVEIQSTIDVKNAAQDAATADKATQASLNALTARVTALEGAGDAEGGGALDTIQIPDAATSMSFGIEGRGGAPAANLRGDGLLVGAVFWMDYRDVAGKLLIVPDVITAAFNFHLADLAEINSGNHRAEFSDAKLFYVQNPDDNQDVTFSGGGIADIRPAAAEGGAVIKPGFSGQVAFWAHGTTRYQLQLNAWQPEPNIEKLTRYPANPHHVRPAESHTFQLLDTYAMQAYIADRFNPGANFGNIARGQVMLHSQDAENLNVLFRLTEKDAADAIDFLTDETSGALHGLVLELRDETQAAEADKLRVRGIFTSVTPIPGQPAFIVRVNPSKSAAVAANTALVLRLGNKLAQPQVAYLTAGNPGANEGREGFWTLVKALSQGSAAHLWRKSAGVWSKIHDFWVPSAGTMIIHPAGVANRAAADFQRKFVFSFHETNLERLVSLGVTWLNIRMAGQSIYSAAWAPSGAGINERHIIEATPSAQVAASIANAIGAGNEVGTVDAFFRATEAGEALVRIRGHIAAGVPELVPALKRFESTVGASPATLPTGTYELAMVARPSQDTEYVSGRLLVSDLTAADQVWVSRGDGGNELRLTARYTPATRTLIYDAGGVVSGTFGMKAIGEA